MTINIEWQPIEPNAADGEYARLTALAERGYQRLLADLLFPESHKDTSQRSDHENPGFLLDDGA